MGSFGFASVEYEEGGGGGTNWKKSSFALDEFSGNLICLSLSCACCESSFHPAAIRSYANGGHF